MFEFKLPDVGEGVAEGEIVSWLVSEGDTVSEDQVLAEVETDKAVVDLPAPRAGTIATLHAAEGEMVPVGTVVVTIDTGEGDDEAEEVAEATESESTTDGEASPADADEPDAEPSAKGGRVFAPPNVRRLARELNVEIAAVAGSGPGGRVTESNVREAATKPGSDDEDVAAAVTSVDEAEDGQEPKSAVSNVDGETSKPKSAISKVGSSGGDSEPADRDRTLAAPATRRIADEEGVDLNAVPTEKRRDGQPFVDADDVRAYAEAQRAAQQADADAVGEAAEGAETTVDATTSADGAVTTEPYRGIRRTIGNKMAESVYTAPHVSHHDTAVVDELVETRGKLKARADEQGISLTYVPFVMKAIVAALQEYPILNSSLDEEAEEIHIKHDYNIGVAVATDAGLMVPVVDNVDEKGLLQLASEVRELAERARDRSLAREEMQGGTFTITNFGAIGGEYATPIINYPETAILGLGALEQRPTVEDGEVVAAHTLPLSLSIDHRVIDGAEAAGFTNTVIEYLEDPRLLLLG
jgi:pyruvate dehydrogenase E2 component (dihydrolipoamide acetyltransferase)